jgi:hypothetical protein
MFCIQAYLSFIQHKSPKIICKSEVIFLVDLTPELVFKISPLEVICDEMATNLEGSRFYARIH